MDPDPHLEVQPQLVVQSRHRGLHVEREVRHGLGVIGTPRGDAADRDEAIAGGL